jgi:Na+/proline symporter
MLAQQDGATVGAARFSMLALAAAGLAVAFVVKEMFPLDRLWWIFNGVASLFVVPTIFSIYWKRLSARPTRSCARPARILPRRSSTADGSHDQLRRPAAGGCAQR